MKKIKVLTVLGTRPEIIRLSRVIAKLDQAQIDIRPVVAGNIANKEMISNYLSQHS